MTEEKIKELVKEHWNSTAHAYQEHRDIDYSSLNFGLFGKVKNEMQLLGNVVGKSVLELGCGGGEGSITLALQGAQCTGIDLSESQLEIAKERANAKDVDVKFLLGDIENLSFLNDSMFDIAFSIFCFDWAQDLNKVFKNARRVLTYKRSPRPSGRGQRRKIHIPLMPYLLDSNAIRVR